MFWKKKVAEATKPEAEVKAKPPKAKKMSPKDTMAEAIEKLTVEEALRYRLPETFGGNLVVIELNPQYPQKGHKYILSSEKLIDDKPSGKKSRLFDADKPKALASWITERGGKEPFVLP